MSNRDWNRLEPPRISHTNPQLTLFLLLIYKETKDRLQESSKPEEKSLSSEIDRIHRFAERSCWTKLEEGCEEGLKEALFGREAIIPKGGRQDKFLQSWIETGYPAAREREWSL